MKTPVCQTKFLNQSWKSYFQEKEFKVLQDLRKFREEHFSDLFIFSEETIFPAINKDKQLPIDVVGKVVFSKVSKFIGQLPLLNMIIQDTYCKNFEIEIPADIFKQFDDYSMPLDLEEVFKVGQIVVLKRAILNLESTNNIIDLGLHQVYPAYSQMDQQEGAEEVRKAYHLEF